MKDPLEAATSELPKLKRELFGIIMLVVVIAALAVSWKTLGIFEEKLSPLITKKVALGVSKLQMICHLWRRMGSHSVRFLIYKIFTKCFGTTSGN